MLPLARYRVRYGHAVASGAECERALRTLVAQLAAVDPEVRAKYVIDRTVSLRLTDLDIVWSGRLCDEGIVDLASGQDGKAQVRLSTASDDLVALTEGRLSVGTAMATGRLRIQASPMDLLRLSNLI